MSRRIRFLEVLRLDSADIELNKVNRDINSIISELNRLQISSQYCTMSLEEINTWIDYFISICSVNKKFIYSYSVLNEMKRVIKLV